MFSTIEPAGNPVQMRTQLDKASFALICGSLGPLAFYAPKGMWIPVLLLLLVSFRTLASIAPQDLRRIFGRNAVFLILPFYAILSAAWALVPGNAAITGAKLLGYFMAAMAVVVIVDRLSDTERRSILVWAAAGFVVVDLFVWADLGTAGALSGLFTQTPFTANSYSRGAAVSAGAVLPLTVGLFRLSGARQAFVFAAISIVTVFVLQNEAAKVAAALGTLVYVVVRWRGVLFWPVILVALAAGILTPLFFANALSDSRICTLYNIKPPAAHRLKIYEFSSRKIFEKPLLGWGMDASRSIPGGNETIEIHDCKYQGGPSTTQRIVGLLPLHPHNASLQVWLELGAIGVVIFIGLLGSLIFRLQRRYASGDGRPLIAGLFTAVFIVYNIGFGLWQSWLIFALISLCAILGSLRIGGSETNRVSAG